jgi:hypothetical protein
MYSKIVEAAKGQMTARTAGGNDRGSTRSVCYLYDATRSAYTPVELNVSGDWTYMNTSPAARDLVQWLNSLNDGIIGRDPHLP